MRDSDMSVWGVRPMDFTPTLDRQGRDQFSAFKNATSLSLHPGKLSRKREDLFQNGSVMVQVNNVVIAFFQQVAPVIDAFATGSCLASGIPWGGLRLIVEKLTVPHKLVEVLTEYNSLLSTIPPLQHTYSLQHIQTVGQAIQILHEAYWRLRARPLPDFRCKIHVRPWKILIWDGEMLHFRHCADHVRNLIRQAREESGQAFDGQQIAGASSLERILEEVEGYLQDLRLSMSQKNSCSENHLQESRLSMSETHSVSTISGDNESMFSAATHVSHVSSEILSPVESENAIGQTNRFFSPHRESRFNTQPKLVAPWDDWNLPSPPASTLIVPED